MAGGLPLFLLMKEDVMNSSHIERNVEKHKFVILVANEDEANKSQLKDENCEIVVMGEGRVNTIKTLTKCLKEGRITDLDTIVNIGYVGAKGFQKGDVLVVDEAGLFKPSTYIKEENIRLYNGKTFPDPVQGFMHTNCFSSQDFVKSEDAHLLPEKCICDMELYWIALIFPNVISVKIVSDTLNYDDYKVAQFHQSWQDVSLAIKNLIAVCQKLGVG